LNCTIQLIRVNPGTGQLTPITLSLLALTTVFATAAVPREHQAKTQAAKISALILKLKGDYSRSAGEL
jgi:hypothetical protein